MDAFLLDTAWLSYDLLLQTIPMMVAGVYIAELIIAMNAADRISRISRPITSFANLHGECGTAFMMAFVSPKAANAMLMKFHTSGVISRREMVIAALMNSFPNVMMHWRYLLPVYIPLLGLTGLVYFLILVLVGFVKTLLIMLAGRRVLDPVEMPLIDETPLEKVQVKEAIHTAFHASASSLRHILLISVPTIILVAFLINLGLFDSIAGGMQGLSTWFPVPAAGFAIIAAQFGSFIAGASVASTLLTAGTLTWQEIIITLLVGNILTSITRGIRWYGSSYAAIFGPRAGAEIQILSTGLRNIIMIIFVILLAAIW